MIKSINDFAIATNYTNILNRSALISQIIRKSSEKYNDLNNNKNSIQNIVYP